MTDKIYKKKVSDEMLRNWILPVQPSGTNCAETAFVFFGLITQQECVLSRTNHGKSINNVTNTLIQRALERFDFKRIELNEELIRKIQPNYMTMALLQRYNNIGHAVSLAVSEENQLVLIDPQRIDRVWQGMDIFEYLREGNYLYPDGSYNIYVAVSKKKLRSNKNTATKSKRRKTYATINNITSQFERLGLGRKKRKNSKKKSQRKKQSKK